MWQVSDVVVEEIELFHVRAHADLRGQLGNLVVGSLQEPELPQLANARRDGGQPIARDVQLCQERVTEESWRQDAEALATHV